MMVLTAGISLSFAKQTTNYLRNGSFEWGLNLDWEYSVGRRSDAQFSLHEGNKIFDDGNVGLKVQVNSLQNQRAVYARTHAQLGSDSLYLLQFWAHGPEEAKIIVEIDGAEQKSVLFETRVGNEESKGQMVAFHYPFKLEASNTSREVTITFFFCSDKTRDKSNDPNDCYINTYDGATYYLDGLVLVDQSNDMHFDVYNTYLWNYNQVPNQDNEAWTAGDNDVSYDLPDGRRMWFFNDSFYGNNKPESNVFPGGKFVRNAVVVQNTDGSLHSLPVTNQGGQNTYFRIPDEDVIYNTPGNPGSGVKNCFWVGDALMENDTVKVYLIEVYGEDRSYLGKFTYPELEFVGIEEQEPFCRRYEKFFVDEEEGMVYLYQNGGSGFRRTMMAAKCELGDMNGKKGTWRFWDGTGWNTQDKGYEVSERGSDDIKKLGPGNYVQIAMPVMSPEVYVLFAPAPEGPWGHEKLVNIGDRSANFWYYMPNLHGRLANGKYSISMSANYHGCLFFCKDCENKLYTDKYWYRQRYIHVDLLGLSPYTTNLEDCAGVANGTAYFDECGECVGGTTGKEACVTGTIRLYGDTGYTGKAIGLTAGAYAAADLNSLGFNAETLSSFALDEGYVAELYAGDNFSGEMKAFEASVEDLSNEAFNDKMTSLIIRRVGSENLDGIYAVKNQQSELFLSVAGASNLNNALLVQKDFFGDDSQKFEFTHLGNGEYSINNVGSGKPLSIVGQSKEAGAYVEQWDGKEKEITASDGEISAQYDDSPGNGVEKLLDKNVNTRYLTFHNQVWVQFKADEACVLKRYTLTSGSDVATRDPKNWTLSGSNDGENWEILDEITNFRFRARLEEQSFSIDDNNDSYSYYRINMTSLAGTILQLAELKLYASTGLSDGEYLDIQRFVVQQIDDGTVRIINKASDKLIEVLDGLHGPDVKVFQNPDLGQYGGLWNLLDPADIPGSTNQIVGSNNIVVSPNPSSDYVNIRSMSSEIIKRVVAVNLGGSIVIDQSSDAHQVELSFAGQNRGVYLLKIYTSENSYIQKLIVR